MAQTFDAEANPEKRLFISLVTRDISLADAIIDLTDNSVNAAIRPVKNAFASADDFHKLFAKKDASPEITIKVVFDENRVARSGPGNLNSIISGNFGYNAGPESVWQ